MFMWPLALPRAGHGPFEWCNIDVFVESDYTVRLVTLDQRGRGLGGHLVTMGVHFNMGSHAYGPKKHPFGSMCSVVGKITLQRLLDQTHKGLHMWGNTIYPPLLGLFTYPTPRG